MTRVECPQFTRRTWFWYTLQFPRETASWTSTRPRRDCARSFCGGSAPRRTGKKTEPDSGHTPRQPNVRWPFRRCCNCTSKGGRPSWRKQSDGGDGDGKLLLLLRQRLPDGRRSDAAMSTYKAPESCRHKWPSRTSSVRGRKHQRWPKQHHHHHRPRDERGKVRNGEAALRCCCRPVQRRRKTMWRKTLRDRAARTAEGPPAGRATAKEPQLKSMTTSFVNEEVDEKKKKKTRSNSTWSVRLPSILKRNKSTKSLVGKTKTHSRCWKDWRHCCSRDAPPN